MYRIEFMTDTAFAALNTDRTDERMFMTRDGHVIIVNGGEYIVEASYTRDTLKVFIREEQAS